MIAWLILVAFTAAINLFVFIAVRGRWGRLVYALFGAASLVGCAIGNAVGDRLAVDLLRIGSFNAVPASSLRSWRWSPPRCWRPWRHRRLRRR